MSDRVREVDTDLDALLDAIITRHEQDGYDLFEDIEPWQYTDKALLTELAHTQRRLAQLQARTLVLLAEADRRQATLRQAGLPTSSWLADHNTHWARTAREEVRLALRLEQQPAVKQAFATGSLSLEQVKVISAGVDRLPPELDSTQRSAVEAHLVELGSEFGPYGLARLANRAVEVVAPDIAEAADRRAVERVEAEQRRTRHLTWSYDPDGTLLLHGKLPTLDGHKLTGLLQALAVSQRNSAALAGIQLERGQANADALLTLAEHYTGCHHTGTHGKNRPRILVSIDHDTLLGRLGTATLPDTDHTLTAHQTRILACDAGILPMVMGGGSIPLDVGRERRLITGTLRTLLTHRDRGCAFPACDRQPAECDAHHIQPWQAGGPTSLANAVLLCSWHHHLIEPDPHQPPHTQWATQLDTHGNPQFGAPQDKDAPPGQRHWRQHHRYRT